MKRGSAVTTNLKQREQAQATICFAKAPDLVGESHETALVHTPIFDKQRLPSA